MGLERMALLFVLAYREAPDAAAEFVWNMVKPLGQRMTKDGAVLESDADNLAELAARYEKFKLRLLPMLQGLQIR